METALNLTNQSGVAITWFDLFCGIGVAFILGLIIIAIYRLTHRGLNYERSFLTTLVLLSPIIAVVMMLIGSNLALSLGMVGSLSIIRFRTVIKDSRDMTYLFLAIAIGLGCGTANYTVIAAATVFLCFIIILLNFFQFGHAQHSDYVLVVNGSQKCNSKLLEENIRKHAERVEIRTIDIDENNWECVFEIRVFKENENKEDKLLTDIRSCGLKVDKTSLLTPQLSLPL